MLSTKRHAHILSQGVNTLDAMPHLGKNLERVHEWACENERHSAIAEMYLAAAGVIAATDWDARNKAVAELGVKVPFYKDGKFLRTPAVMKMKRTEMVLRLTRYLAFDIRDSYAHLIIAAMKQQEKSNV